MRILYTSEYKGDKICGVLTRVRNESEWMREQGNEIHIICAEDFGPRFRISDNTSIWNFGKLKKYILELKPDIIVCNTYRHLETHTCLNAAKELGIPYVLVTHASFLEKGVRGKALSAATWLYDMIFTRINDFDAVIGISHWEMPYLWDLGVSINKFWYLPNALPDELFQMASPQASHDKILFLGRIVPIKDIPTLLKALSLLKNDKYKLTLAGPVEEDYKEYLDLLYKPINWTGAVDFKKKVELLNSNDIFILPSKREGMPQALLEAMAMGHIVISSRNQGALEIIKHGQNGFLFNIGDEVDLHKQLCQINILTKDELMRISDNALTTAKQFAASKIYPQTEKIYKDLINERH